MASEQRMGAACLANDTVVEWLVPFCESLRRHNPGLALTVIPFDDRTVKTRSVLDRYGYELFDGPSLEAMDALGRDYWPGDPVKPHIMRKFCAWETYDTFLFMDADIVVLRPLDPYFKAMDESDADFMHFATDMVQVYKPGPWRERMLAEHEAAGFNSGVFMGRRAGLQPDQLDSLASSAAPLRTEFVDNLEQTFINYCVDITEMRKVDANDLVGDLAVAGALMRITRSGEGPDYVLDDRRVPYSGRIVSMIHWAGYGLSPFMPYRRIFLRYRLAGSSRFEKWRHDFRVTVEMVANGSIRGAYHVLRGVPYQVRGWLSARGLAKWRGSQT